MRALAQPILLPIGTYIVKIQQNLFTSLVRKRAVKKIQDTMLQKLCSLLKLINFLQSY